MDPRLQPLAGVIVEIVARELQTQKKPPSMPDKRGGGFGDFESDHLTTPDATAPTS
jgi:hypothetical protein